MKRLALTLALLPGLASAQTVAETVRLALAHHPAVQAADADIAAAQAGIDSARANERPRLGVSGEFGRSSLQTTAPFPESGGRWPNTLNISLSQPVYTGGALGAAVDMARLRADAALADGQDRRVQVAIEAIAAHAAVVRDQSLLALYTENLNTLRQAALEAGKRFQAGEVTRTDVAQANARAAEGEAQLAQARAALAVSRADYERITGQAPQDLPSRYPDIAMPASLQEALEKAQQNPALLAARHQAEAQKQNIVIAKADGKPQVSVEARGSTQDNTEFGYDRLNTWGAYVKAQVNLFDSGRTDAKTREAQAAAAAAKQRTADLAARVRQTMIADWQEWQATAAAIPAFQAQVDAASLARDSMRKELQVGTRTTLDLLNAEQELLSAKVHLLLKQQERSLLGYQVLAVIGDLSVLANAR